MEQKREHPTNGEGKHLTWDGEFSDLPASPSLAATKLLEETLGHARKERGQNYEKVNLKNNACTSII